MQELPLELYASAQIRELEHIAIAEGVAGFELMRRAGNQIYQHIATRHFGISSLAVFCGAGNNAGDGYIVATLALESVLDVCVFSVIDPEHLKGDALDAYKLYIKANGKLVSFKENTPIHADLIVDALFGTGLNRTIEGVYVDAINAINACPAPVVAVDIPSGLCADTGNVLAHVVKADSTVTFIGLKQGLFTGQAADYCGEIFCSQLGIEQQVFIQVPVCAYRVEAKSLPKRKRTAHKGNNGHVLVIGGDLGYSGAVRLASEASLRVGAGLVSLATREQHAGLMNISRPEIMSHGIARAEQLYELLEKASVIVIGPGLGQSEWSKSLFSTCLTVEKPMVIDADGLNLLAQLPTSQSNWILTPHPGEAARLLQCTTAEIQADRFASATSLQKKYQGIAVLKGSGTLIASIDKIAVVNTGNPGMASGGMGDVLSGVIGGLLAQGLDLQEAAEQGVYGHGRAADLAAAIHGERGILASDLMPWLQQWVNE
jgi:NAD(P)H-hydrate epimerase